MFTCVMIMLFIQLLDMPHLSGEWIILAKGEMLTNRDVQTNVCTESLRNKLFVAYGTFLGSFISAPETVALIFLFSVYEEGDFYLLVQQYLHI